MIDAASALEHRGEERALGELGVLRVHLNDLGGEARPVAVALGRVRRGSLVTFEKNDARQGGVGEGPVEAPDQMANLIAALLAPGLCEQRE